MFLWKEERDTKEVKTEVQTSFQCSVPGKERTFLMELMGKRKNAIPKFSFLASSKSTISLPASPTRSNLFFSSCLPASFRATLLCMQKKIPWHLLTEIYKKRLCPLKKEESQHNEIKVTHVYVRSFPCLPHVHTQREK